MDEALWKLERKELYLFMMEEALTPSLDGARDIEPRVVSLAWSPPRLINPCRCLLATITSAGAVDILFKVSRNWFSAYDLSTLWLNEVYELSGAEVRDKLKEFSPRELRECLRQLKATAVTWSDSYEREKECFAYLVVAYHNSEITIWRVSGASSYSEQPRPYVIFKTLMGCEKAKIHTLKWIDVDERVLVVVGYLDGRVDALSLDNKLQSHSVNPLWAEPDSIPVSRIEEWKSSDRGRLIVVCKGSFLVALNLPHSDGGMKETQFIHIGGFSISGLVVTSDKELLVSTQDGSLFEVGFRNDRLACKTIKHNLPSSNLQYLGLSSSLNKALLVNITSPNVMHDHLITREPSTMCIFTIEGRREWNPLYALENNDSQTLTRHWDCLESIRVQVLKSQESNDLLPPIPDSLDKLTDYELRLAMWNLMVSEAFDRKKYPRRNTEVIGEMSDAHPLIFLRLASGRLEELGSKENLSTDQRTCANLLRSYIEVYIAGEEEEEETKSVDAAKKALSLTNHLSSVGAESCDICGELITELSWKITSCPAGHKLPRCAVTLLQVSSISYRSCPICGQILHPCLDKEYEEPLCPYCQVPAVYDSRVLDIRRKSNQNVRNLSKRRFVAPQTSRTQDVEKPNEEIVEM